MARIVITGGPGAGKTALLADLHSRGHTIVGDTPFVASSHSFTIWMDSGLIWYLSAWRES